MKIFSRFILLIFLFVLSLNAKKTLKFMKPKLPNFSSLLMKLIPPLPFDNIDFLASTKEPLTRSPCLTSK